MKRLVMLSVALLAACGGHEVEKPDNLIPRDKMVDIIFDLQLLEAIRTQKPDVLHDNHINPDHYVYMKYHIDSLQFAKSNQYYAHDLDGYKEIYDEVQKRFENGAKTPAGDAPMVQ